MSIELQHDCVIESPFVEGGYTAECSCGWEGTRQETGGEALEEWENHCDVVFMEADQQIVYILHSQHCLALEAAGDRRLTDCPYSLALDRGIDVDEWVLDKPVRVMVSWGRLVPCERQE